MSTEWWGVYDTQSKSWRTENPRSNYDDFVGRLIFYPSREIAQAHVDMLKKLYYTTECPHEARRFMDENIEVSERPVEPEQ